MSIAAAGTALDVEVQHVKPRAAATATPRATAAPNLSDSASVTNVRVSGAAAAVAGSDAQVKRAVEDFQIFISFILTISIFGASTFAVIIGQMTDPIDIWKPDPPPYRLTTVRAFLRIAWMCFTLAIAVAGYSSSIRTVYRERAGGKLDIEWQRRWDRIGIISSVALHLLLVAAFLFLSLAMVAYVGIVGWVAVGFSRLAGVIALVLSAYQCLDRWIWEREEDSVPSDEAADA
ncbi:hypothetical protein EDB81DRAFT_885731 [Dactylonectria macrodidyma]|uniref:Uncharacterized protein n=1 Tax=Dactylonectria macrodidyma TaxID=307937 RepID=A0A9P9EK95_9HYPO|nr:hypothetical protein EDB81DRAFT_885731 [Dactylonectria macrodidyma]